MPQIPELAIKAAQLEEDRFSRFRLIQWWDQQKIGNARVLVVGAGALGNEILKNLALLGFRNIIIVDLDKIELSNLSRSVLYRESDVGKYKSDAAAAAVRQLAPDVCVTALHGSITTELGLGLFAWADIILAGLDNREARLWINRSAWKVGKPWIDGAIEGINGVARVFVAGEPACYECTLGEKDWELLEKRMSCNLLTREDTEAGKVATTPTTSSVIAGIQVQEAVKLLHGLPTLAGKGFVFEGLNHSSYVVEYSENPDCQSHHTLHKIIALPQRATEMTLAELYRRAQSDLKSDNVVIEFSRDVIYSLECPSCNSEEILFVPVGRLSYADGKCPVDGSMRVVKTVHSYTGSEDFGKRNLTELGLPLYDIFSARSDDAEIGYLISGDQQAVLGACAAREDG
jgi:adenylyltransferase/sulfurtransferase